mmetsp:Transcript_16838/g.41020  ORF Transcript_16838/g.41020 Transcript_16838/m.41020 type:complete len:430 (-) Transcript_16838:24-1313(-)
MDTIIVHKVPDVEDRGVPQQTTTEDSSESPDTQDHNEEQKDFDKSDNSRKCGGKKLWILIAVVVIIVIVAIVAGVSGSSTSESSSSSAARAVPTEAPTPPYPTESPSQAPTVLRYKVESILEPIVSGPLDEQTMDYLVETSSWEPDAADEEGDPDYYNYQWLERYAMANLYFSTKGPKWAVNNNNWLSDAPTCAWFSLEPTLRCPGPVTDLVLKLVGLEGSVPPVLFELTALTKLNLARNQLIGTEIPRAVENLKNLTFLDLANTRLTGHYLEAIQSMTNLKYLYLSGNSLKGQIPTTFGDKMKNLKVLSLSQNKITGTIPQSIGYMLKLQDLELDNNRLSGTIPATIGNLINLERLSLNTNRLRGTLPDTVVQLKKLQKLTTYENWLGGPVPPLPNNTDVELDCFLGQCHTNYTNAVAMRCIISAFGC